MSELSTTIIPSTSRSNPSVRFVCLVALTLLAFTSGHAEAADDVLRKVAVADPYLEMHTGPGRGYPIFHVVDRGESVEIVMQRTDWYQVRAANGVEGWVDQGQMQLDVSATGMVVYMPVSRGDSQALILVGLDGQERALIPEGLPFMPTFSPIDRRLPQ